HATRGVARSRPDGRRHRDRRRRGAGAHARHPVAALRDRADGRPDAGHWRPGARDRGDVRVVAPGAARIAHRPDRRHASRINSGSWSGCRRRSIFVETRAPSRAPRRPFERRGFHVTTTHAEPLPISAAEPMPSKPPHIRELTVRSVICGLLVAVIMGASYPYIVLKLGF